MASYFSNKKQYTQGGARGQYFNLNGTQDYKKVVEYYNEKIRKIFKLEKVTNKMSSDKPEVQIIKKNKVKEKDFIITVEELSKILHITVRTIYNWNIKNKCDAITIGDINIHKFEKALNIKNITIQEIKEIYESNK